MQGATHLRLRQRLRLGAGDALVAMPRHFSAGCLRHRFVEGRAGSLDGAPCSGGRSFRVGAPEAAGRRTAAGAAQISGL